MTMSAHSDAASQLPAASVVPTSASAHVLVVDDLEINRDLLARRVKRLGHTFAFAASGKEALDCLRTDSFDLVLLDITMPEMDGYEALAQIKADPTLAHIPVVMVTAIDGVDSIVRCLELGAEDYITKPFNPVILRARIESSLNKKRLIVPRDAHRSAHSARFLARVAAPDSWLANSGVVRTRQTCWRRFF
jgi:CheY-like chemotaxis protein